MEPKMEQKWKMETPQARSGVLSRHLQSNASFNLKMSLDLLDEATNTSGILRTSMTQRTPKIHKSPVKENTQLQDVISALDFTQFEESFPTIDMSTINDFTERILDEEDATIVDEEMTPEISQNNLETDFLEQLRKYPTMGQVFELVENFERLCWQKMQKMKQQTQKLTAQKKVECSELQEEAYTWRLIHILYSDRLLRENMTDADSMIIDVVGKRKSPKVIVDKLFERDSAVRQCQMVVDWLENIASDAFNDTYFDRVEYFNSNNVAWENTLHHLQTKLPTGSHRQMVQQMDPDAPLRENRPLHDLDREDELRLLKHLFCLLRSGKLVEAEKLCQRCGQPWRAATLEGWRLFHDPNYECLGFDGHPQLTEGNPFRDIWKNSCWRLSQEDRLPLYERSLYAALSGNLRMMLPVCNSWDDYLWAYFRTMVDVQVEQELRNHVWPDRPLEPLPAPYWDQILTQEVIFQEMQSTMKAPSKEMHSFFKVVQKHIILDNTDGLIEELYEKISATSEPPVNLTRFMSHVVLFLRAIGRETKEELCVAILESYIKFLIDDKQSGLIASYTATLPKELQVYWYAKFLEGVVDKSSRQECLRLAEQSGLDIAKITKMVVENVRARQTSPQTVSMELSVKTSEEDLKKIDALDWLIFDRAQRAEALRQANGLMRTFLASRKLDAAQAVFTKIPPDSIDVIIRQWQSDTGSVELSNIDKNSTREYLCLHAYLDAHFAFNDWFEHYHHSKPEKPELNRGATFTERVAFEHHEKQFQADLNRWQQTLAVQTKTTVEKIYNVLLFVDGGWLVDQYECAKDTDRKQQLKGLRQLCLPQLVTLLHSVLFATGKYKESIQLADIIASEQYQLYKVFDKDNLRSFFKTLSESSVKALDGGYDPFGNGRN